MIIHNIEKFMTELKDKERVEGVNIFAQVLKRERIKRQMTLDEVSKGICSISYLSKLENNVIAADPYYVRVLCEKIKVNYDGIMENIVAKSIDDVAKYYFYGNKDVVRDMFEGTNGQIYSAKDELIEALHYYFIGDFDLLREKIACIDSIINALEEKEAYFYLIMIIEYHLKTYQYCDLKYYLNIIDQLDTKDNLINIIFLELKFLISYHIGEFDILYKSYYELKNKFDLKYPISRQILIRIIMHSHNASSNFDKIAKEIQYIDYDMITSANSLEIEYYKIIAYLNGRKYLQAYEMIIANGTENIPQFAGLLAIAVHNLKNDNNYVFLKDISKKLIYDRNDIIHKRFIDYQIFKAENIDDESIVFDYLKHNIIPCIELYKFQIYTNYYKEDYLKHLIKTTKYKEALKMFL